MDVCTGSITSPWRFQGRILESADGSTDLYDFSARSYDPGLGAFTSFDSVTGGAQNPLTLNRYLYANANPATLVDPDGHFAGDLNDERGLVDKRTKAKSGGHDVPTTPVCAGHDFDPASCKAAARPDIPNDPGYSLAGSESVAPTMVKEQEAFVKAAEAAVAIAPDCRNMSDQACENIWLENIEQKVFEACYDGDQISCRLNDDLHPNMAEERSSALHMLLAVMSFVPVLGLFAAGANSALFVSEGDPLAALLAGIPLIPFSKLPAAAKLLRGGSKADGTATAAADAGEAAGFGTSKVKGMIDACAHSFGPTTSVAVSSGKVAIADLKVGDQVMAYDPKTGETAPHVVTAVMVNLDPATEHLVTDAGAIETTPNHPFFTTDRGWVEAGELRIGEQIRTESGAPATVLSFTIDGHPASMWDLTVSGAHSFFVGSGAVLVHNCNIGQQVADHSFNHSLEFPEFQGSTVEEWGQFVDDALHQPGVISRGLSGGRTAYWNDSLQMVIVHDPVSPWAGTALSPKNGIDYFWDLP